MGFELTAPEPGVGLGGSISPYAASRVLAAEMVRNRNVVDAVTVGFFPSVLGRPPGGIGIETPPTGAGRALRRIPRRWGELFLAGRAEWSRVSSSKKSL